MPDCQCKIFEGKIPLGGGPRLEECGGLREGEFIDFGDRAVWGGVADDEEEEGFFGRGALEDLVEEAHRAGGVGEGREAGVVEGGDEKSGGDAGGFLGVVGLAGGAVGEGGLVLLEDRDAGRGGFEKWFVPVGFEGFEGIEPFVRGAGLIELPLLGLGGLADLALDRRVLDDGEVVTIL